MLLTFAAGDFYCRVIVVAWSISQGVTRWRSHIVEEHHSSVVADARIPALLFTSYITATHPPPPAATTPRRTSSNTYPSWPLPPIQTLQFSSGIHLTPQDCNCDINPTIRTHSHGSRHNAGRYTIPRSGLSGHVDTHQESPPAVSIPRGAGAGYLLRESEGNMWC